MWIHRGVLREGSQSGGGGEDQGGRAGPCWALRGGTLGRWASGLAYGEEGGARPARRAACAGGGRRDPRLRLRLRLIGRGCGCDSRSRWASSGGEGRGRLLTGLLVDRRHVAEEGRDLNREQDRREALPQPAHLS